MSDAKNFVTVKIEEPTRDDAREDPRTYTEIMEAGLGNPTNTAEVAIDSKEIKSTMREIMAEQATINVSVDTSELDIPSGSNVTLEDVENVVERQIEKKVAEEVRG